MNVETFFLKNYHIVSGGRYYFLAFFCCSFLCTLCCVETVRAYTILSPKSDKPLLLQARKNTISLILKVTDKNELSALRVERLTRLGDKEQVIDSQGNYGLNSVFYVHYILPLKKGTNRFRIFPDEGELKIRYRPIRTIVNVNFEGPATFLFHRKAVIPKPCSSCHTKKLPKDANLDVKRLQKNSDYSPACFSCHRRLISRSIWLHSPSANVQCMSCHQQKPGKTMISILEGRVDDVCFGCHVNKRKFKESAHVHGPVGTGDCTVCHDPHGDNYKFQLWADGRSAICIGCHADKRDSLKQQVGFYSHGIIQGGGCVSCHDAHSSPNRFQLYKPINELCTSCHTALQRLETGHPVGNHPLSNKPDPRRKGRELSCTSCHNPHGSNYRYLLIGDLLGGHVCSKCHH